MNFCSHRVPARFLAYVASIKEHYKTSLKAAVTLGERQILSSFEACKNEEDVPALLAELFGRKEVSDNEAYLRSIIDGLQNLWRSKRLESMTNHEGWRRLNLYAVLWDRLFLPQDHFYVKRA